MSVGNLLPRTRPNLEFGIRTRRTLSDRRLVGAILAHLFVIGMGPQTLAVSLLIVGLATLAALSA